jgi:hypothetical protein
VGLRDIGVLTRPNCLGEKGPYGQLAFANLRQEGRYLVDRGLLKQRDVDAVIALCGDPGFTDIRSITVYGWGRKLLLGSVRSRKVWTLDQGRCRDVR